MSVHIARGPLSSPIAQWAVLGLGVVAVAGKDNVSAVLQRAVAAALQSSGDGVFSLGSERSLMPQGQAPIVIHSGPQTTTSGSSRHIATLIQLTVGAGACWASYIVISTCLPDAIKELLPVTRKFFDAAVTSLGKAIISVRDALASQIADVSLKQDELSAKQDATHDEVLAARDDLDGLRNDIDTISASVLRCESSLVAAERRQTHMARGVRLLVKCVGALLPGNATLAGDLERYGREAEAEAEDCAGEASSATSKQQTPSQHSGATSVWRREENQKLQQKHMNQHGLGECNPQMQTPARGVERMDSVPECTENEHLQRKQNVIARGMKVEDIISSIRSGGFTVT